MSYIDIGIEHPNVHPNPEFVPPATVKKNKNLRPCVVDGRKAFFHCWSNWSRVIAPSPMVGGHPGGTISGTLAIVEYEDGTVGEVDVCSVRFTDGRDYND